MVDMVVYLYVSERKAQEKLGWIGKQTAFYLKNAELIAKATNGKVWVHDEGYNGFRLEHSGGSEYAKLQDIIEDIIVEAGAKALEEGKIAENVRYSRGGAEQKVPVVDVAELYGEIKKATEEFERKKKEEEERKERLEEQWKAFKQSPAYKLYNNYYHNYLDKELRKEYEGLYDKVENTVLSDEELKEAIHRLEQLYMVALEKKYQEELKSAKERAEYWKAKHDELTRQLDTLREFIAQYCNANDLLDFLRRQEEPEKDDLIEKAKELVPGLFEGKKDY